MSAQFGVSTGAGAAQKTDFEAAKQTTVKFMKDRVLDVDAKDQQVWQLITDVPLIKTPWQYVCFVLNVIVPGLGTMIASCFSEKWSKTLFMVGLFQLFLAYILVGWVFSIYWGFLIVRKSWQEASEVQKFLSATQPRSEGFGQPGAPNFGGVQGRR